MCTPQSRARRSTWAAASGAGVLSSLVCICLVSLGVPDPSPLWSQPPSYVPVRDQLHAQHHAQAPHVAHQRVLGRQHLAELRLEVASEGVGLGLPWEYGVLGESSGVSPGFE